MKHSEIKEMIRRVVQEKKLTAAEKKKKEQIVKGMKKSFKGDEASMYAIATAKAKKIAEVQGTELTSKIFDIGSTLKKIEVAMDFGMNQDPEVIKGLDQAYGELINILALIEKDREERKFVNEDIDIGHQDDEPAMLKNELARTATMAAMLYKKIKAYGDTGAEIDFPQWWQSNIIKAKDYLQGAFDYLDGEESVAKIDATMDALKMEEKDPLDVVVSEKKGKDLDEITAAQLKYAVEPKPKQSDFRKQVIAAKKMFDAGATEKQVLSKFSQTVVNAVNSEASLDDISEKKGKDLTGNDKIDSADYLKARDIAIKKAQAKKK
jgi:hypothetical protein